MKTDAVINGKKVDSHAGRSEFGGLVSGSINLWKSKKTPHIKVKIGRAHV